MAQLLITDELLRVDLNGFSLPWSPNPSTEDVLSLRHVTTDVFAHIGGLLEAATSMLRSDGATSLLAYFRQLRKASERAWFVKVSTALTGAVPSMSLMAAVELRYWATLILDDIADDSDERCGEPTLHRQIGTMKTVYLAEVLMGMAMDQLAEYLDSLPSGGKAWGLALKDWATTHQQVNDAQYLDLAYADQPLESVAPDQALNLIDGTTGIELASCFRLGGIAATCDMQMLDDLHALGQITGLLMQLRDDCLDFVMDPGVINKEPLLDIRNQRKKIPLVVGYHHATDVEREEIRTLLAVADFDDSVQKRLTVLLFSPPAVAYINKVCEMLTERAARILSSEKWNRLEAVRFSRFLSLNPSN